MVYRIYSYTARRLRVRSAVCGLSCVEFACSHCVDGWKLYDLILMNEYNCLSLSSLLWCIFHFKVELMLSTIERERERESFNLQSDWWVQRYLHQVGHLRRQEAFELVSLQHWTLISWGWVELRHHCLDGILQGWILCTQSMNIKQPNTEK